MNQFPNQPLPVSRVREGGAPFRVIPAVRGAATPPLSLPDGRSAPLSLQILRALYELQEAGPVGLRERALALKTLCGWVCEMHGIQVELQGRFPAGPAIIVANHLGYIDPLVLCSLLACSPIAKHEIEAWALIGVPLARLNVNFVRRGDAHSGATVLRRCLRTLRAGVSVLNFPEGTTSRSELRPFHWGAFWLARRSGVPLVPVGIEFDDLSLCWVDDEAFLPHYAKLWWKRQRTVRVCVGEPLDPGHYKSELDLGFAARRDISALRHPFVTPATPWE